MCSSSDGCRLTHQTGKARRTDVSLRLKERRNLIQTVVPCSLSGRLGVALPHSQRVLLYNEIDTWATTVSKVVHRLSIIMNRFLLYCLSTNTEIPRLDSSLFTGLALHGMKVSNKKSKEAHSTLIDDFCSNEFDTLNGLFPKIERQRGDCQAIVIACKKYETNLKNAIWMPFFIRQKKYIRVWLNENKISGVESWEVQKMINRWGRCKKEDNLPVEVKEFIVSEQQMLVENVDESWLKKNPNKVFSYYYHILKYYHEVDSKKFRLAPLCQIKSHFMTIDNR